MISSELKMMVAQNCSGYKPISLVSMTSLGNLSESCSNCANYIRGRCIKDLFEEIRDTIRIN
jgi:hypothetical protein